MKYEDPLDAPPPHLVAPGVAPAWRVVALLGLLAAALLFCVGIVLWIALFQQARNQNRNTAITTPPYGTPYAPQLMGPG